MPKYTEAFFQHHTQTGHNHADTQRVQSRPYGL